MYSNKMMNNMQWTFISWVIKYLVYETTYIVHKNLLSTNSWVLYEICEGGTEILCRSNKHFTVASFFPLVHFISCHGKCIYNFSIHTTSCWSVVLQRYGKYQWELANSATVNSAKFRNYHHLSATLCFNLEAEQIFILAVKYLELCSDVHCMNLS